MAKDITNLQITHPYYTPQDLQILINVLNSAPSYLSKRFILQTLCGWPETLIRENLTMKNEEDQQMKIGDKAWR